MYVGILRYREDGVVYLECGSDLNRYLRELCKLWSYGTIVLESPMRGSHITVVSQYETVGYKVFENQPICFDIVMEPQTNGNAYWLPVKSRLLELVRECLRLGEPSQPLHIIVGYLKPGKVSYDL